MTYSYETNRFEEAEAKVMESLSYLIFIIPGIYVLILILEVMGYNFGNIQISSFTDVLINLIWVMVIMKILDLIAKSMNKKMIQPLPR
jgi:hypothetical protein